MTTFKDIINLQKELDDKLKTFGNSAFTEAFAAFFAANPAVDAITWTQYTPYFNDGDACTFGVGDPRLVLNIDAARARATARGDEFDEEEAADTSYGWDHPCCLEYFKEEEFPGFEGAWGQIPESIFLAAFGDHAEVIVRRDGTIDVQDYDHD